MAENAKKRGPGRPRRNSLVNEDTHKVEQSHASASARPSKSEDGRRVRRRSKGSVGGFRDVLTVTPKDENFKRTYVTRWVKDKDEGGHRIKFFYDNDWDFVSESEVVVGENFVYKTRGAESIVRVPAGTNSDAAEWLFLMKKYRDWFTEDQIEKLKDIDATERYIDRQRNPDMEEREGDGIVTEGMYGGGSTKWRS